MDGLAAVALAGTVVQFLQFSLELFSYSRRLYQSSQGALPENLEAGAIAEDLLKYVAALKLYATLAGQDAGARLTCLSESCVAIAEELFSDLERIRSKGKGKWPSLKAGISHVWARPKIEALRRRLDAMTQEFQLCGITSLIAHVVQVGKSTDAIQDEMKALQVAVQRCREELQGVAIPHSQIPKELGFGWETGRPEDHVRVDDGLGPVFYLPQDLCASPEVLKSTLELKYSSRNLPGLSQMQQGHFEAFNWSETVGLRRDNWCSLVKDGHGIKISIIMGTWHGFSGNKCLRCFKPRKQNTQSRRHQICSSCGLDLRFVEPDAFNFEPEDITIGMSPDAYRDHRVKSPSTSSTKPRNEGKGALTRVSTPLSSESEIRNETIPIDMVCRRITLKWEPIYNMVHRYLHCRCVIRLSTPSQLVEEMTFFISAICPRHNDIGKSFRDYGDIDYHQDSYFDRFGGYDCFRAMIYLCGQNNYTLYGSDKFLSKEEADIAIQKLMKHEERNPGSFSNSRREYFFDVNEHLQSRGFDLPSEVVQLLEEEKLRRNKDRPQDSRLYPLSEEQRRDLHDAPIFVELREILNGKWSGRPHWVIE